MGDTKIILISRRWPQALLHKFQQGLGIASRKASYKLFRIYGLFKEKRDNKKN